MTCPGEMFFRNAKFVDDEFAETPVIINPDDVWLIRSFVADLIAEINVTPSVVAEVSR